MRGLRAKIVVVIPVAAALAIAAGAPSESARAGEPGTSGFIDVTPKVLSSPVEGRGGAWVDYDGDGDLDLSITNWLAANQLFRNDDGVFVDVSAPPMNDDGASQSIAWADYDNDGDVDAYMTASGSNKLYRNDGGGVFVDATPPLLDHRGLGRGGSWGDYDGNGWVDLYLSTEAAGSFTAENVLYRNALGTFVDETSAPLDNAGVGRGVIWCDLNNDRLLDIYLVNGGPPGGVINYNVLFQGLGHSMFADATVAPANGLLDGRGVTAGDYDNDGDMDLYISHRGAAPNRLLRNEGGFVFTNVTPTPLGDSLLGRGVAWADYDNDGDLDLYLGNVGSNRLWRNDGEDMSGQVVFTDVTDSVVGDLGNTRALTWGDYDGDGDLDLYIVNDAENKLFQNALNNGNHWIHFDLVGTDSNRSAIGARVFLVAGGVTQMREVSGGSGYLSQESLIVEFGLGQAESITSVEILWPSGFTQTLTPPSMNQKIRVVERQTPGDVVIDGVVDALDLAELIGQWGTGDASADLTGDYQVNAQDLAELLGNWSQ